MKNDGVYTLPPGRIGTSGLMKVDFDSVKFWTVFAVGSKKEIIRNGAVTGPDEIRVIIR